MNDYKSNVTALTPKNFHVWIAEIKSLADNSEVWAYIDPAENALKPARPTVSFLSDFEVQMTMQKINSEEVVAQRQETRADIRFLELSADQREI